MPPIGSQKIKVLRLLAILLDQSDEDHPISTPQLCQQLALCGIQAERKSIYADLAALEEFGIDIVRNGKGVFIGQRDFELAEVRLLMDAVQSSRLISQKKAGELIGKLGKLLSIHDAQLLKSQCSATSPTKSQNEATYYAIDVLHRAIARKKCVRFVYLTLDEHKNPVPRRDKPYTISPYALIWKNDCYYAVANTHGHDNLSHYRVDRMKDVQLLSDAQRGYDTISGCSGRFDAADYARRSPSMIAGEHVSLTLRCTTSHLQPILDQFGADAVVSHRGDDTCLISLGDVQTDGLISWLMHFANEIEVVQPQSLRQRIYDLGQSLLRRYAPPM